ncbi:transposable element Tcb2 transposase [Trichonephila clavipes]|nr:transposable element Tcb2 transposase [Trichonephila clavipes]
MACLPQLSLCKRFSTLKQALVLPVLYSTENDVKHPLLSIQAGGIVECPYCEHDDRDELQKLSIVFRTGEIGVSGTFGALHCGLLTDLGVIRYQTDKLAGCVGGTETTRNTKGMQSHKCRSCQLRCTEVEGKEQAPQHINGTENILCGLKVPSKCLTLWSHCEAMAVLIFPKPIPGVGSNGFERCHLHEDQAQDALNRPDVVIQPHCKKYTRTANCFIGRHPGTGSTSTRGPVSYRIIRRHLAEEYLGSRLPLHVLPLTPTHRHLRLEWCRVRKNWTAVEWDQVVFSDESRFNLSSYDNRVRVWRPRGERLNLAFALQRHAAPALL